MRIDRVLAVVGVVVGVTLTCYLLARYDSVVYTAIGILSTLACVVYLLPIRKTKIRDSWLCDFAFWAFFIGSLAVYFLRPDDARPLGYFILTALSCGAIASGKNQLLRIMMVGVSVAGTVTAMFPSLIGLDPYWHRYQTMQILDGHNIGFSALPGMSYWIALIMHTGLTYKAAAFLGVTVLQIVANVLLIYGIGKMVSGRRVGLLAALILVTANWQIFFGIWPIPNSFAVTMLLGCIFSVVKWHKTAKIWWLAPILPLLSAIMLTHALVIVWAALALGAYVVVCRKWKKVLPVAVITIILLVGGFLSWKNMGYVGTAQSIAVNISNPDSMGFASPPGVAVTQVGTSTETLSKYPFELLLNSAGMFLLFSIAIIGLLMMVRRRKSGEMYIGLLGAGYLVGGLLPIIISMAVLQERWWYMAEVLLVIPVALAIKRTAYAPVIVCGLAFLGMIGLPGNIDNRSLSQNQIVRYALTADEVDMFQQVMENVEGNVGVDDYYTTAAHYFPQYRERLVNITDKLVAGERVTVSTVIIREEVRNQAIGFGNGVIYKLNYDPILTLQQQGYRIIYRNQDVTALRLD
jgi:hypothetical protein